MPPEFHAQFGIDNVVQPLKRAPLSLKRFVDHQGIHDAPFGKIINQDGFLILGNDFTGGDVVIQQPFIEVDHFFKHRFFQLQARVRQGALGFAQLDHDGRLR